MAVSSEITLANDLENAVLERFDKLVTSGDILYEASEPEIVQQNGFQVRYKAENRHCVGPTKPVAFYI
jgi:hypothetical protein